MVTLDHVHCSVFDIESSRNMRYASAVAAVVKTININTVPPVFD